MHEELIAITKKEYDELIRDSFFFDCLVMAGVDEWEGWNSAIKLYNEYGEDNHG